MSPLRLLLPLLSRSACRFIATVISAAAFATALGLVYPVQRQLNVSSWSEGIFETQIQFVLPAEQATVVEEAIGSKSCLVTTWLTDFQAHGRKVGPARLFGVAPGCDQSITSFPEATIVRRGNTTAANWIDLTADAAKDLGVTSGDEVLVRVGPDLAPLRLVVRSTYAVRPDFQYAGRADARQLFAAMPQGEAASYGSLFTTLPVQETLNRLKTPGVRNALSAEPSISAASRAELWSSAAENSTISLGLVRVIGALALIGGLAVGLREHDIFRRRLKATVRLTHVLGGDARMLLRTWTWLATGASAIATVFGALLGLLPYALGWFAPALPLPVVGVLGVAVGLSVLIQGAVALALSRFSRRELGC